MHWTLLFLATTAWGSPACLPCHQARGEAQSRTPHARSLSKYSGEHFNGRKITERGGISYSYSPFAVTIARGADTIGKPLIWAFGSGEQAVTLVLENNRRWVEHRVSWYRDGDRLSLTPGHDPAAPIDLQEALGVSQSDLNARRCFGCHQTAGEPGIHCQTCHGEGAAHRKAPVRGNIKRDRSVTLCSTCHRSPDATFVSPMPELEDARSIRFAPIGLQVSKCFQKSRTLTCVTCHNPHGETAKPVNTVCTECHVKTAAKSQTKKCPRTPDACVTCHMQSSSPVPNLNFTDHRIRVYAQ